MKQERGLRPVVKARAMIDSVVPGSIGEEIGIEPGDEVTAINGQAPGDIIDYRFLCAEEELEIEIKKKDGEVWLCDVEKGYDEDLGLVFSYDAFDGIRRCANRCVFCFVDQMPPDMRESLYVKDDDYRLSFLHGNFVTLTNLTDRDWHRIISMHMSPLYVSVHTTNPELREQMLGSKKAGAVMDQLSRLAQANIEIHTQIVLCPGLNDGDELARTVTDLTSLHPRVRSVAVVPVGLTSHREGLYFLRKFTAGEAQQVIKLIHGLQTKFIRKYSDPLVYLADEFYVMAGQEFPPAKNYGEFPQLENGVGLVRLFYDSFAALARDLPAELPVKTRVALVTGVSGAFVLKPLAERLNRIINLQVDAIPVKNGFFGEGVTVAGLLTGTDVVNALKGKKYDLIMLPSVMCRRDEPVFLDGKTPADIADELSVPVRVININEGAAELIEVISG